MVGRFLLKDIALQAGVGTATVDRVLNDRGNVRWQTVQRVHNAISELEKQSGQLALTGARLVIDLVVEAPGSFREAIDEALENELPLLQPAAFQFRKDMRQTFSPAELERSMLRAERSGSHGLILMAPDAERVRHAIDRLVERGVPVVTLATDLPGSGRRAYVGLDNPRAGETAAWFFWRLWGSADTSRILLTVRNDHFRGEEQRAASFRQAMKKMMPSAKVETLVEGHDSAEFIRKVSQAATSVPYKGLYSVGGNNVLLLHTLEAIGHPRPVVVAHDLDPDNRGLIKEGRIDLVIYHDLSEDVRNACRVIMSFQSRGQMPMPSSGAVLRLTMPPMAI